MDWETLLDHLRCATTCDGEPLNDLCELSKEELLFDLPVLHEDVLAVLMLVDDEDFAYEVYLELDRRYRPELERRLRMRHDAGTAQDVAQECWFALWLSRARFLPGEAFKPWMWGIVNKKAKDSLRRQYRRRGKEVPLDEDIVVYEEVEESLVAREVAAAVRKALRKLPPRYQVLLVLKYVEELSVNDMAKQLEMPAAHVKLKTAQAEKQFKGLIIDDPALNWLAGLIRSDAEQGDSNGD